MTKNLTIVSELVESFAEFQITKEPETSSVPEEACDASEPVDASDYSEAIVTFETQADEEDSEKAHYGSEHATFSKNPLKYKPSHLEDLIIGKINNPLKT
jgi:hypothetical protein